MIRKLRERWQNIWQKLGVLTLPPSIFEVLIKAYSSPDRFYHNLLHVEDCLSIFDQTRSLAAHPEEVEIAIWFHDAVYDPKRSDNEQKSAKWAETVIMESELSKEIAERVSHLILATRHNREMIDADGQLMVDVDLSILGREASAFWQYEDNIRKEYAWVPEDLFRQKRVEILNRFLERPHIFYHQKYRELFEEKAGSNLKQAIAKLKDGTNIA